MPLEKLEFEKAEKKIEIVPNRRYITNGTVLSLKIFFCIPKGYSDIRLVYDITACSMNKALWYPKFWLPSVENV